MRSLSRSLAIVSALLVVGASAASAQHPQTRKGFWIGFGLGWGSYGIGGDSVPSGTGREGSYTAFLKLGGTINPHLLIGAESVIWSKSDQGLTLTSGNVTASAFYYPKPAGGFFLNGGVGFSRAEVSGGGASAGNTGPGFTLGTGYDLRVGTNVSITPVADYIWGRPQSGFNHNFFNFAVGVTFH
jgi:hypothetical protein